MNRQSSCPSISTQKFIRSQIDCLEKKKKQIKLLLKSQPGRYEKIAKCEQKLEQYKQKKLKIENQLKKLAKKIDKIEEQFQIKNKNVERLENQCLVTKKELKQKSSHLSVYCNESISRKDITQNIKKGQLSLNNLKMNILDCQDRINKLIVSEQETTNSKIMSNSSFNCLIIKFILSKLMNKSSNACRNIQLIIEQRFKHWRYQRKIYKQQKWLSVTSNQLSFKNKQSQQTQLHQNNQNIKSYYQEDLFDEQQKQGSLESSLWLSELQKSRYLLDCCQVNTAFQLFGQNGQQIKQNYFNAQFNQQNQQVCNYSTESNQQCQSNQKSQRNTIQQISITNFFNSTDHLYIHKFILNNNLIQEFQAYLYDKIQTVNITGMNIQIIKEIQNYINLLQHLSYFVVQVKQSLNQNNMKPFSKNQLLQNQTTFLVQLKQNYLNIQKLNIKQTLYLSNLTSEMQLLTQSYNLLHKEFNKVTNIQTQLLKQLQSITKRFITFKQIKEIDLNQIDNAIQYLKNKTETNKYIKQQNLKPQNLKPQNLKPQNLKQQYLKLLSLQSTQNKGTSTTINSPLSSHLNIDFKLDTLQQFSSYFIQSQKFIIKNTNYKNVHHSNKDNTRTSIQAEEIFFHEKPNQLTNNNELKYNQNDLNNQLIQENKINNSNKKLNSYLSAQQLSTKLPFNSKRQDTLRKPNLKRQTYSFKKLQIKSHLSQNQQNKTIQQIYSQNNKFQSKPDNLNKKKYQKNIEKKKNIFDLRQKFNQKRSNKNKIQIKELVRQKSTLKISQQKKLAKYKDICLFQ